MKGERRRDSDRKHKRRGHIATFTLGSGESEQWGFSSISSGLMCWREPGGGNITGESGLDAERAGGREINGDPPGGYTKEKVKLFPSFTLTVFLRLPLPVSFLFLSLMSTFSHQIFSLTFFLLLLLLLKIPSPLFFLISIFPAVPLRMCRRYTGVWMGRTRL